MMKSKLFLRGIVALALTLGLALAGCSTDSDSDPKDPALTGSVTITGANAVEKILTANTGGLNGSGTLSYQWERVDSANGGSYAAISGETSQTYTTVTNDSGKYIRVTVTRAGYSGSITSGIVKIYADEDSIPKVSSVTVSPSTARVAKGGTQKFTAFVTGDSSNEVSWRVDSSASSIDSTGKLTVGSNESKTTLTVTATSVADTTKKGTATVTVTSSSSTTLEGTWTASGGRVVTFTGNNFDYKVNGTTKYSGTFSISGSTLTFYESKLGSASGNFQLSGGTLTLSNHTWDSSVDGVYSGSGGEVPGGGEGTVYLGETFTLTGQVELYTEKYDKGETPVPTSISYSNYTGAPLTVTSSLGDTGAITQGQLNITIKKPDSSSLKLITQLMSSNNSGYQMSFSNPSAQSIILSRLSVSGNNPTYYSFFRGFGTVNGTSGSSGTQEVVMYIYVDRDVTITVTGQTASEKGVTVIAKDAQLSLKTGWNTVYQKMDHSGTSRTISFSLSNPSNLKWMLLKNDD